MPRILVTGGAGLVGSHLCERLLVRRDHEVLCLDSFLRGHRRNIGHLGASPRFALVRHDVTEPFEAAVDAIYHLALSPCCEARDPLAALAAAVDGTRQVLELARRTGARLVIASSRAVQCERPEREGKAHEGIVCAEAMAACYAAQHGLDVRIAHLVETFGPRMRPDGARAVARFIERALTGDPITITGDDDDTSACCYVGDVVEGLIRLMREPRNPGPIDLGDPRAPSLGEMAREVVDLLGSDSRIRYEPTSWAPPPRPSRSAFDWYPLTPWRRGLLRTLEDWPVHRSRTIRPAPRAWDCPASAPASVV